MTVARDYLGDEDMPEVRLLAGRIAAAIEADRTQRTPDLESVRTPLEKAGRLAAVHDCRGAAELRAAINHALLALAGVAAQPRGEKL